MIKCNDVQEQTSDLAEQLIERWRRVFAAGDFVLGDEVLLFENWMSQRCGSAHAVSMNSGTDALFLALRALGIGAGDEVITCSNTFVATVGAIVATGARPIPTEILTLPCHHHLSDNDVEAVVKAIRGFDAK